MNKNSIDLFDDLTEVEKKQGKLKGMISAAIINKRYSLNLSQKELAKKLGVTQGMISKLENTEYNMTVEKLVELFEDLDITYNIEIEGKHCINNNQIEFKGIIIKKNTYNGFTNNTASNLNLSPYAFELESA